MGVSFPCQLSELADHWQYIWATIAPCRLLRSIMLVSHLVPFFSYGHSWPKTPQGRSFQKCSFSLDKSEIILAILPILFFSCCCRDYNIVGLLSTVGLEFYHFMYNSVNFIRVYSHLFCPSLCFILVIYFISTCYKPHNALLLF